MQDKQQILNVVYRFMIGFASWWILAGIVFFLLMLVPGWFLGWSPDGGVSEVLHHFVVIVGLMLSVMVTAFHFSKRGNRAAIVGLLFVAIPCTFFYIVVVLLFSGLLDTLVSTSVRSQWF